MEQKFKSLSIFEFQEKFPDDDACLKYLEELKWAGGYECPKCGNKNYCKGNRKLARQCTTCRYNSSPTAGTMYHKLKFPLLKAFYIVYYMSTGKKGVASTELSRKLSLRQKTCWAFQQKVKQAMKSSGKHKITGKAEVDETVVGGQEEEVTGREKGKKKLVVFAIERTGKGISRAYGKVISNSSGKELGNFMEQVLDAGAEIKTDKWAGYAPLKKKFKNLVQVPSGKKGKNFHDLHRVIMSFKSWLRGIHHHAKNLQGYIDEFTYRYNRSQMKEGIFDNLMLRMVNSPPRTYKEISSLYA